MNINSPIRTKRLKSEPLRSASTGTDRPSTRTITITGDNIPELATRDLIAGWANYEFWSRFAIHDIRQRFRRSVLGPFWLTLTMGIMVGALALVFGTIFKQNMSELLPYVATGVIFWGLVSTCISEGTNVFTGAEGFIRNVPMPISAHFYRMIARNVIIWTFNMVIYFVVVLIFPQVLDAAWFLFIPGFVLLLANIGWMALAAGILSARYRDIPQVITNILQVIFLVTPIFWSANSLPDRPAFVTWNPLFHILEVVREPLLGRYPSQMSWYVSVILLIAGSWLTLLLYRRAYSRLPYWL